MNNGPNTRSYSPVPVDSAHQQRAGMPKEDPHEKLKVLVKDQIAHEVMTAMVYAELAEAYWKMGLMGHKYKMCHIAVEEFKETFDWRKFYHDVFDEVPKIVIEYETKDHAKSLDEIHNRLYDLYAKNKANLHAILMLVSEHHMYEDMNHLLKAYQKCEKYQKKLECKSRRAQTFGYDVSYILDHDEKLKCKYKHYRDYHKHDECE
jgi:hypothetical protein